MQSTDQEGRFTEADERLLSTIASAVGVAFHNAKLFEEARLAKRQRRKLMPPRARSFQRSAMNCERR